MKYLFNIEMGTMIRYTSLAAFVVTASAAVGIHEANAASRPNSLVILYDDLGYGDLGCFGHRTIRTPHLDHLAAEGLRLTDCYASAPVGSQSRTGMLTGRTPSRVGVYDWIPGNHPMHLRREETTVATTRRGLHRGSARGAHVEDQSTPEKEPVIRPRLTGLTRPRQGARPMR